MKKLLYIDDNAQDIALYGSLLQHALADLDVTVLTETPSDSRIEVLTNHLDDPDLEIVVLDFELRSSPQVPFTAAALAGEISARRPDVLVLGLSGMTWKAPTSDEFRRTERLFDRMFDKTKVAASREAFRLELGALILGFRELNSSWDNSDIEASLTLALGAAESESLLIENLAAELANPGEPVEVRKVVTVALSWLLGVGALLDSRARAMSRMGVSADSGDQTSVAHVLDSARYTGVFAGLYPSGRFWPSRLTGLELPEGATAAECAVCQAPADVACDRCDRAYDSRHVISVEHPSVPWTVYAPALCALCLKSQQVAPFIIPARSREAAEELVARLEPKR